jgi:hypothetical protein
VVDANNNIVALKITLGDAAGDLHAETAILAAINSEKTTNGKMLCATPASKVGVTVSPDGQLESAFFTLTPVGISLFDPQAHDVTAKQVFELLLSLHQAGYAHGDARLENIILHREHGQDGLLWIDLITSYRTKDNPFVLRSDLHKLVRSWKGNTAYEVLSQTEGFKRSVDAYGSRGTPTIEELRSVLNAAAISLTATVRNR